MKLSAKQAHADKVKGNTQYPMMQTLWKNDIFPPNNWAFNVTVIAPNQTITNTDAKTRDEDSLGAVKLKIDDNIRQTIKGPHKSPKYNKNILFIFLLIYADPPSLKKG